MEGAFLSITSGDRSLARAGAAPASEGRFEILTPLYREVHALGSPTLLALMFWGLLELLLQGECSRLLQCPHDSLLRGLHTQWAVTGLGPCQTQCHHGKEKFGYCF